MSEEDANLTQSLHKLKILPKPKQPKLYHDDNLPIKLNPFAKRSRMKSLSTTTLFGPSCVCRKNRVCKNTTASKKLTSSIKNKLLRDPVIVLHEKCKHELSTTAKSKLNKTKTKIECETPKLKSELFGDGIGHQDFRSIIAGCEQLTLSNEDELQSFTTQNFRELQAPVAPRTENRELSSCSQQAMARLCLNPPCDVTIDELASYFETFVHIPKKMSSMAEMMYI